MLPVEADLSLLRCTKARKKTKEKKVNIKDFNCCFGYTVLPTFNQKGKVQML